MISKKVKISKLVIQIALILWALIEMFPLFFMFMNALKSETQVYTDPFGFPKPIVWENLKTVWTDNSMGITMSNYFMNSIFVTIITMVVMISVSLLCGYALARHQFKGRNIVFFFIICLMAIPTQTLLTPIFLYFDEFNLLNNIVAISLLYSAFFMPLSIIIAKTNFEAIPKEIEEAAYVDGSTGFKTFLNISLPMSRGSIATLAIINLTPIWSEFMFASVLLLTPETRTLPVAVSMFQATMMGHTDSLLLASLSIATIPLLIIYFIFQKQIVKGMQLGAIK